MTTAYVDASALAKLVLDEPDGPAMRRWWVEAEHVYTSRVGVVEIRRAVARWDRDVDATWVLRHVAIVEIDATIAERAAVLAPPALRTLDAIHLATAVALHGEIDAFVTYDARMADAARSLGLPVVRPA